MWSNIEKAEFPAVDAAFENTALVWGVVNDKVEALMFVNQTMDEFHFENDEGEEVDCVQWCERSSDTPPSLPKG